MSRLPRSRMTSWMRSLFLTGEPFALRQRVVHPRVHPLAHRVDQQLTARQYNDIPSLSRIDVVGTRQRHDHSREVRAVVRHGRIMLRPQVVPLAAVWEDTHVGRLRVQRAVVYRAAVAEDRERVWVLGVRHVPRAVLDVPSELSSNAQRSWSTSPKRDRKASASQKRSNLRILAPEKPRVWPTASSKCV